MSLKSVRTYGHAVLYTLIRVKNTEENTMARIRDYIITTVATLLFFGGLWLFLIFADTLLNL